MVSALLNGSLNEAPTRPHPIFGIHAVTEIPTLPSKILDPRSTWADPGKYDVQARKLAEMFDQSFKRYADRVPEAVRGEALLLSHPVAAGQTPLLGRSVHLGR